MRCCFAACAVFLSTSLFAAAPDSNDGEAPLPLCVRLMLEDKPVALWSMESKDGKTVENRVRGQEGLTAVVAGGGTLKQPGPRPSEFPLFDADNDAFAPQGGGRLKVADPGDDSPLDFGVGDSLTLEAWVQPLALKEGQQVYILGKGRTKSGGENQSYALRLRCLDGTGRLSFLFRSAGEKADFHRWNSNDGIVPDTGWHHVAVTFTFGKAASIRGYIDGKETAGKWDMAGASDAAPVVDNDDLWIGSSMGGNADSTFVGLIDEAAVFRSALPAERFAGRYQYSGPPPLAEIDPASLPNDRVQVEIIEKITERSWNIARGKRTREFSLPAFALHELPHKYNARGVIDDRSNPFLVALQVRKELPAGTYRLLLRSLNASRLVVDGKALAQTEFLKPNGSGHEHVPLPKDVLTDVPEIPQGHQEKLVTIDLAAGEHVFRQEIAVGGAKLRPEIGEASLAIATESGPFELLAPSTEKPTPFTDAGWEHATAAVARRMVALNAEERAVAAVDEAKYWNDRHAWAKKVASAIAADVPAPSADLPANNAIDHFLNAKLAAAKVAPTAVLDKYALLRRLSLDLIGLPPSRAEISAAESPIERLLIDPRGADHGVGYWQDVLAENPGIVKPTLNNTGPFRTWIYESLLDHKPLDRFATELILMEGSKYYGGPAGFAMATENDAPFAEKANVLAKAFLGQEMKCARCHDAPSHPFEQRDLFSLAAMLNRGEVKLPSGSTVPKLPGGREPLVTVTLKPGDVIKPQWPFAELVATDVPAEFLRSKDDARERLAALITSPHNSRFAEVAVNRLWKRLMGRGIVEPVDDWSHATPSHPELLAYLARELALHDYDVTHVTKLIVSSHAYQRQAVNAGTPEAKLFAGPTRRRMAAEQIVDSLFAVAEKAFEIERLTLDPEGRLSADAFLNLGQPTRSWQMTSLSTDRDRPALGLPRSQAIVDLLGSFGWRDYRPNPLTERDEEPNVLQPLGLANGLVSTRIARMSDDNVFTAIALEAESPQQVAEQFFLQTLSRRPTAKESAAAVELLTPGFADRVATASVPPTETKRRRESVSWSNHLSPEATEIKYRVEKEVRAGDPPTARLNADWRMRAEDLVWSLVNSPEFVFLP